MGIKLKTDLSQSMVNVPGPGNYQNNAEAFKTKAPQFGFGSSKRPDISNPKFKTPGPGDYKLPSKIGNVADFAMPGRSAESKYI